VDEHLKTLMKRLGHAINESLSDSEAIAEAIGEIKSQGYDVFLVLEATIGFNRAKTEAEEWDEEGESTTPVDPDARFTEQDQAFLKALKITVEE